MVEGRGHTRSNHHRRGLPDSAGDDSRPPQAEKRRHNTGICRACEMCRLRLVPRLWDEPAEQKPLWLLPLQQKRAGAAAVFHALYPL